MWLKNYFLHMFLFSLQVFCGLSDCRAPNLVGRGAESSSSFKYILKKTFLKWNKTAVKKKTSALHEICFCSRAQECSSSSPPFDGVIWLPPLLPCHSLPPSPPSVRSPQQHSGGRATCLQEITYSSFPSVTAVGRGGGGGNGAVD